MKHSGMLIESLRRNGALGTCRRIVRYVQARLPGSAVLRHMGYCPCCDRTTRFISRQDWLRDHYRCVNCFSLPRHRQIVRVLHEHVPGWETLTLHESSPSTRHLAVHAANYSCSYLLDGVVPGAEHGGLRCENLESLTFADASFDLFVTQDVLEHVFNPEQAVREIMRVLRPGGSHVFTAPRHAHLAVSRRRARSEQGGVTHLLEPEYHGNPVGDGRALVTWDYGLDFESLLSAWTGYPVVCHAAPDAQQGIAGDYLDVFIIRKG